MTPFSPAAQQQMDAARETFRQRMGAGQLDKPLVQPLDIGPLQVGQLVWAARDFHPDSPDSEPLPPAGGVIVRLETVTDAEGTVDTTAVWVVDPHQRNVGASRVWDANLRRLEAASLDMTCRRPLGAAGLTGHALRLFRCIGDRNGYPPVSADLLGHAVTLLALAGIRALPSAVAA